SVTRPWSRQEIYGPLWGFTTFSNTPGLSTSSTNGISILVSSEALVSVTRPNPKGEANALECNNRRVVPPPQPEQRPSDESRDRGYRLQRPHLGHCLAGDAHGAAGHRITPPDAPAGRPVGWRTGRVTPEAGMGRKCAQHADLYRRHDFPCFERSIRTDGAADSPAGQEPPARTGERGQVAIPCQHEPRTAHAAQRRHRPDRDDGHQRDALRHREGTGTVASCERRRDPPFEPHQRDTGPLEDRSGQA